MKKKIKGLMFVRFKRKDLYDFRHFILPHVYEDLVRTDNFDEDSIVAIAALVQGVPAGVVIARLLEEEEIFIFSIMVADNYRGVGIGNELIEYLMQIGTQTYAPRFGARGKSVRLFLHTEYALSGKELENFESFLKAEGFSDFYDKRNAYMFRLADLKDIAQPDETAVSLNKLQGVNQEDLTDFYLLSGITPALNLSYYSGSDDDPEFVMLMHHEGQDLLSVSCNSRKEDCSFENFKRLAARCINEALEGNPDYSLLVNGSYNIFENFWAELAAAKGETYRCREAGLYAMIESDEDRAEAEKIAAEIRRQYKDGE